MVAPNDSLSPGVHTLSVCRNCALFLIKRIQQRRWDVTPVIIFHYIKLSLHIGERKREALAVFEEVSCHL